MQTYIARQSQRRRRAQSSTISLKDTPQLRLIKIIAVAFLAMVGIIMIGGQFLAPVDGQSRVPMTAEQEKACTAAYLSGDRKAMDALCNPSNWHSDRTGDVRAALP